MTTSVPAISPALHRASSLRETMGLLTEEDICLLIDVHPQTLRVWRTHKEGPRWTKLGRTIFYRRQDVEAWIEANLAPMQAAA
jgi:predicted DNA-binding transcriptional regulator AlpA